MLDHINIYNLLYIDIETVPAYAHFDELNKNMQLLWATKHEQLRHENETPNDGYINRAGIYSEFGKIICVSMGMFYKVRETGERKFRVKTFAADDECTLLQDLSALLIDKFSDERFHFCGHNIREFDLPFICRRLLINGLTIPPILNIQGKRPWEVNDVDTLQLWKFGDYKHYTSLKLLAEVLGLPTPKDDIDGKDVCRVYWQEHNLNRIATYCQKDVITVARLLLKLKGEPELLTDSEIEII